MGGDTGFTIKGANFGVSAIGWHMDGCMRYRDPENPDATACLPGVWGGWDEGGLMEGGVVGYLI